jgi:peptidyl-prolyl cis-trans isomerase SurA
VLFRSHDGILLFEVSSRKVWNRSQEDSAGLKQYYENNKSKYMTRKGLEGRIYILKKKKGMSSLAAAFKRLEGSSDTDNRMIKKFIVKGDSLLVIKKGIWYEGDDKDIDGLRWIKGYQESKIEGFPCIAVIESIIEPQALSFNSVQGEMISGYQNYLENKWIEQLKENYPVKIDNAVLEEIRNKLKNE